MSQSLERTAAAWKRYTGVALALLFAVWLFMVIRAPADQVQGIIYKILFVHAPCAFGAYLGFILTAVCGGLYLWRDDERYDQLARSGAEVGLVFCTLVILTGPVWAQAAWGKPWVWDPRLVVTAILWVTYLAYVLLRAFALEGSWSARAAAVYGIAAVMLIPLNYFAIDLFGARAQHPENLSSGSLGVGIGGPFLASVLVMLAAFAHLMCLRVEVAALDARAARALAEARQAEA